MILFSQQLNIIEAIWSKFQNKPAFINQEEIKRSKLFLNASKYENFTLANFKVLVIYSIITGRPKSKINLLQMLNLATSEDIKKSSKLKSDISAKKYIIDQDKIKIKTLKNPYHAYKKDEISIFGMHEFYSKNPDLIKGRIMKKDFEIIDRFVNMLNN